MKKGCLILRLFNKFSGTKSFDSINYSGVTIEKRKIPIIISLSSEGDGFRGLSKTVYSLLSQKRKPDRVILWLSDEFENITKLPYELTQFIKNGLEIRSVKDCSKYTNSIEALKEFPKSIIVTVKENVYYGVEWLDKLYMSYAAHPDDIHVHNALRVCLINGEAVCKSQKIVKEETARFDNIPISAGGILYPPDCFSSEVFRKDIFSKIVPVNDNIWFWAMALLRNRKIRVIKEHIKSFKCTGVCDEVFKIPEYNEQLAVLMRYYRSNLLNKF